MSVWQHITASPLFALGLTLAAYSLAFRVCQLRPSWPLANLVLWSVALVMSVLVLLDIPYPQYFEGAYSLHMLLGPATVALAVPLFSQLATLKKAWLPIMVAVMGGSLIGIFSTVMIAKALGADADTVMALSLKSITTPIAMAVSETMGGSPSLTAAMVIITGVSGASLCSVIFMAFRINDDRVRGISVGVTSHGIGTARALQINQTAGAFSGLAMALTGVFTAVMMPWLGPLLF